MGPATASEHLRNRPRQARSRSRVEHLLDVAEEVLEEVGYDAATTTLIASRAEVPVGTLYRWFPDKAAIAEALTDRYLASLVDQYDDLLQGLRPEDTVSDFIRVVLGRLIEVARRHRALPALLVSSMVPGGRSPAGQRLNRALIDHIGELVEARVPGIPRDIRDRTAQVCVSMSYLVLAAGAADEADAEADDVVPALVAGRDLAEEYVDAIIAYLIAKFPPAHHPAWSDPTVAVKPVLRAPDADERIAAAREGS